MLGFYLKKFIARLFFPVPLCLEILAVGILLLHLSQKRPRLRPWGFGLASGAFLLFLFFATPFGSRLLLAPLENRHVPYSGDPDAQSEIRYVVVLGGSWRWDEDTPPNGQINAHFLARIVEGVRLLRLLPREALLVVSVPGEGTMERKTEFVNGIANLFDVAPERFRILDGALDTLDETNSMEKWVGQDAFLLVTSASHLPRAAALAEKRGLRPIPCPADFLLRPMDEFHPAALMPSAGCLECSERAIYEYIGLVWSWTRGQI
jgi:uncharacterized SAM-binding protein YcdF (DUF218 family)